MRAIMLLATAFVLSACSSGAYNIMVPSGAAVRDTIRTAELANSENRSSEVDMTVTRALAANGISPIQASGSARKPDVLVAYSDSWRWDLTTYLNQVSITFSDPATGETVGIGEWFNTFPHNFTRGQEEIYEIIRRLKSAIQARKQAAN